MARKLLTPAEILAAQDAEENDAQKRKRVTTTAVLVGCVAVIAILMAFSGDLTRLVGHLRYAEPRRDLATIYLLDYSKSVDSINPAAKKRNANAVIAVGKTLATYGTVSATVTKFACDPATIYEGPFQKASLATVLDRDYVKANYDPKPGSNLAPPLAGALAKTPRSKVTVIVIGASSWDDGKAVADMLAKEKQAGRKMVVLTVGIDNHDVVTAARTLDLRACTRDLPAVLGNDVSGVTDAEFQDALHRFLPDRLTANGLNR